MKHSEEQDPTWDLLGRAQRTRPSANFVEGVMGQISAQDSSAPVRFRPAQGLLLAVAAALAIGLFVVLTPSDPPSEVASAPVEESVASEITIEQFTDELDELAYLDDLMSVPDLSLLDDEELATLLF